MTTDRHAAPDAALRREPAPGRRLLRQRHRARRRDRAAGAGQGALLQQPQRHRRRVRVRRRICRAHASPSSSMPTRAASPPPRRWPRRGTAALALRPGLGVRRHRRGEPHARRGGGREHRRDLHRSDHRAGRDRGGAGGAGAQEEPAPAAHRRDARSGAPRAQPSAALPAAFWCRRAMSGASRRRHCAWSTRRAPTEAELADLLFAFRVCKHVKSNAIVYRKRAGATVGIGAGQMSRVDAARIAAWKAAEAAKAAGLPAPRTRGSVAASDAFFPFADGLEAIDCRRRDGGDPARRLDARRRGDRRRRRRRHRHGVHRHAPLPALITSARDARTAPGVQPT